MPQPAPRRLLLDLVRIQLHLGCREVEGAVTALAEDLERLAQHLSAPMDEPARQAALGQVLSALSRLQFHDRQRQRMEHMVLALDLARAPRPRQADLQRLSAAFTLPEERDAWARLCRGETAEAVLSAPWVEDGPPSELF